MSFDKPTRNLLAKMTAAVRDRLAEDIIAQLQSTYGMYPDGSRLEVAQTPEDRYAATELRALLDHFESAEPDGKAKMANSYQRLVREIGFTMLNRLAALRLCEERGLVIECVRKGMNSAGFQLYDRLAGGALGNRYQTYRAFIEGMFDELAEDLGALFDRSIPQSAVFPSEPALEDVLALLNDTELANRKIWQQDETIGWIYQYYNDPAERKKMRDESQAPRTSRELAVRNQFFTPRYVVEFLTDNTLGRTWYEMLQGKTKLIEQCRYLVRRKHPIFLQEDQDGPLSYDPIKGVRGDPDLAGEMWVCPNPEIKDIDAIFRYALTVGGYDYARQYLGKECGELANATSAAYKETGKWEGTFEELRCCLFFEQRRWHHFGDMPGGDDQKAILALHQTLCEQWDHEVDVIPYRSKKDPRQLRILDPACGSGHFLLYAFDLLETIYTEAYDDPDLGPDLNETFPDRVDYQRQVPRLILENNLHGIDIDPRAAQIAALALWLRAQRAWQAQKLGPAERPQVGRTHIVVAEPMPGDEGLLEEFIADLPADQHPEIIGPLMHTVFERMKLAGEAGSLLKIEEELKEAVKQARIAWSKAPQLEQLSFLPGQPESKQLGLDLSSVTDISFWRQAEDLVLQAMENYARQAENGKGMRRRLFAGDAGQGFAFIDLCQKSYDVALLNPPFGLSPSDAFSYFEKNYPYSFIEYYACFVERSSGLVGDGFIGVITSRGFVTMSRLEEWRKEFVIPVASLLLDLGQNVMDEAVVESCAYVLGNRKNLGIEALDCRNTFDKATYCVNKYWSYFGSEECKWYFVKKKDILLLPESKLIYKIGNKLFRIITTNEQFDPQAGEVRTGLTTFDDFRFLRLKWEVNHQFIGKGQHWEMFSKGGEYAKYYTDVHLLINRNNNGSELAEENRKLNGQTAQSYQGSKYYYRPGLTFTSRSQRGFSVRALPSSCVISHNAPTIYFKGKIGDRYILGWVNSRLIRTIVELQANFGYFVPGLIKNLPWIMPEITQIQNIDLAVNQLLSNYIKLKSFEETSTAYSFTPFKGTIKNGFAEYNDKLEEVKKEILVHQNNISSWIDSLYGIDSLDLSNEILGFNPDDDIPSNPLLLSDYMSLILSYIFGTMIGLWDIRLALEPDLSIASIDPFGELPPCSSLILTGIDGLFAREHNIVSSFLLKIRRLTGKSPTINNQGEIRDANGNWCPAMIPESDYPLPIPWVGILVDDHSIGEHPEPHDWDIIRGMERVLQLLWPENHEAIATEACQILGVSDLREYFRRPSGFFADHLKRYSKSRRQAPIYWPLSTPSGSYTLWIYYHRLTSETLYTANLRYLTPKIEQVERYLSKLESDLTEAFGRSAGELRDNVDKTRAFLSELNEFRTELLRVANLPYQPDLNDGVIINAAPLYKLFRLTKWSKDCQAVWEKLEEGEYDWAHMAYVLWPERVREKCKSDKSLAIAHGLEELYLEKPKGKKTRCKKIVHDYQKEFDL
ncbi:MAG: BREX-1 system adenine-specific DNA-methyltransferase PglX [Anaerolineaceae bacterium]|nr:BREX-1 system adenine-specific DNA-methyltransferase PglX [Anaerolineaceae bacterium]